VSTSGGGAVRRVRIHPSRLAGTVAVPGDKSLSHRALLIGAMVGGRVEVDGVAPSGDVAATAQALRALDVEVALLPDGDGRLAGSVTGPPRLDRGRSVDVDCGNSGTSLRLLAGVAAALPGSVRLFGDASLSRRPVGRVVAPLAAMGARLESTDGRPPLTVHGGRLSAITWRSPVASAQVKSAILLAALSAAGTTTVVSPLPSRDHTERLLTHLGGTVMRDVAADGQETVTLVPGPLSARPIGVARDPSSAAFWHVAAAAGAGTITTVGLCLNTTRTGALRAIERWGGQVRWGDVTSRSGEPVGDVTVAPSDLAALELHGSDVVDAIDELPVLAVAGAMSAGGLLVRDAQELRVKESDRIATTVRMLGALGVEVEGRPDGYRVEGGQRPGPGRVDADGDHRIAMAAAVAAVVGTGPVVIDGFEAVSTSYPGFLEDLGALGGSYEVLED
jgi:3-phosphoshikimate 1-carboxyvinyltransferase